MENEKKLSILVVGDIMIDRYTYVNTERQAPEAPIPVWDESRHENRLGGAANVAHNLRAIGGDEVEVFLCGIVATEDKKMIGRLGIDTILCTGAETMYKDRYVDEKTLKYLFRCDNIRKFSSDGSAALRRCLEHFLVGHTFDAVIFSDYNKGTIDQWVVDAVRGLTKLTVVDSKRVDLSLFRGANVLKVNESEYATQVTRGPYTNVESLFDYVVVTKGKEGSQLRQAQAMIVDRRVPHEPSVITADARRYIVNSEEFPTIAVEAKDVTGCGDTHTAAMTFSILKNGDVRAAVKFANLCARNVVQKFGTSVVQR